MGVEKAELKAEIVHEIGNDVDDTLDASLAAAASAKGESIAYAQGAKLLTELHARVDEEITAKKMDLKEGAIAKLWITRAATLFEQLADKARHQHVLQQGHAQGVKLVVQMLRKRHAAAVAAVQQHQERHTELAGSTSVKARRIAESQRPQERPVTQPPTEHRPGGSIAPRRRRSASNAPDA